MGLGFGVMIFLVLITSISGLIYANAVQRALSTQREGVEQKEMLTEIRISWFNVATTIDNMLVNQQAGLITRQLEDQVDDFIEKVISLEELRPGITAETIDQNQSIVANLENLSTDLSDQVYQMTDFMKEDRWVSAQVMRHTDLSSIVIRFNEDLDKLDANIENDLELVLDQAVQAQRITRAIWIITSIVALVAGAGISFLTTTSITTPMDNLASTAQAVSQGDLSKRIEDIRGHDEISEVAVSFNKMTDELQMTLENLEKMVADRTAALERRAVQFQAAAEVGRAATNLRDLDELLPEVTRLISERFGFYHTGIFLLDSSGEYAVLQATNSEGGKRMLDRQHKLKVGEVGIVGYATGKREARIALDVGRDAVFFDNPDLPETHSEMALPLIAGDELLGALDVQSKREAAFSDEDIAVLQVLADQVAIAIENARLFQRNQEMLESARRTYSDISQAAWSELLRTQPDLGFLATSTQDSRPVADKWDFSVLAESDQGDITYIDQRTIAIPIILRDQLLGAVRLKKPEDATPWTDDEIELMDTLIDQLEVALESARLYRETQRRAEREQRVTEITTKIRATTDPQAMLRTAVSELKEALQAHRAQVVLNPNNNDE
jgi:GAF domain-containing protein/HAMP domain-containing protein